METKKTKELKEKQKKADKNKTQKEVNKNENITDCIIGSMDVEALYPSIDIDFSVDRCVELIYESGVEFINIDVDELGLYLSLCLTKEELIKYGIEHFCPTRKHKGKKPTITGSGSETNESKQTMEMLEQISEQTGRRATKENDNNSVRSSDENNLEESHHCFQ